MSIENRILQRMENKQKSCYICNKRGHTKYECRQSPYVSKHIEKRHDPDVEDVVVIMEQVPPLADFTDENQLMKYLLKSLHISKEIKPDGYNLKRPWTHYLRKNDVKIIFKTADVKKTFMAAIESRKNEYYKDVIYNYKFIDKSYKLKVGKKEYKLVFREDLPYEIDKMYTKALEIKEQFGVDCVMVGNHGKVIAHKRDLTYYWCKNEDDLERLKKNLDKQNNFHIMRKRKLLRIMPIREH